MSSGEKPKEFAFFLRRMRVKEAALYDNPSFMLKFMGYMLEFGDNPTLLLGTFFQ